MTDTISNFKNEVLALKAEATQEAYKYFEENIHLFERDEKGRFRKALYSAECFDI